MPYLPQGATPAQRDAFSKRLARHLLDPQTRSSLMHLREAFARAGGFSDAHAAQAAIKQDSIWRNPLLALGASPSNSRPAYRFLGIHPDRLFEWARTAWRKYPQILAASPFTAEHARMLLACLWGYPSWSDAMAFERKGLRSDWSRALAMAPSLEGLHQKVETEGRLNFRGLHIALGRTDRGEWVGLSMKRALTHALVIDEDRARRYAAASRWITHRINSDDSVFLVDASADNVVSVAAQNAAREAGRSFRVFDFTQEHIDTRYLNMLGAGMLTELIWEMVGKSDDTAVQKSAIIGWVGAVALRWHADQKGVASYSDVLARELVSGPDSLWWKKCVGLLSENLTQAQADYHALPQDWSSRIQSISSLLKPHWRTGDQVPEFSELSDGVWVFRLPFLLSQDVDGVGSKKLLIATYLYKQCMANGLIAPLVEDSASYIEGNAIQGLRPMLNVHVDVPFEFYASGEAVVFAHSRALGCTLLRIGSSSIFRGKYAHAAILANVGTKIVNAQSAPFVNFSGVQMPVVENGKAVVFHGDQVDVITSEWTA